MEEQHGSRSFSSAPISVENLQKILITTFGDLHVEAPGIKPLFHHGFRAFGQGSLTTGRGKPHIVRSNRTNSTEKRVSVFIVERGRVHIRNAGRSYDIHENQLTILDTDLDLTIEHMTEYQIMSLLVPKRKLSLLNNEQIASLNRPILCDIGPARVLKTLISDLYDVSDNASIFDMISHWNFSCDMFSQILRELTDERPLSSGLDSIESRILHFVESNYFNPDLDQREIAMSSGVSLRTINRALGRHGSTLADLVMRTRIYHARRLLHMSQGSEVSIATIAHEVGFKDPAHFSRVFKRYMGITPGAFRSETGS